MCNQSVGLIASVIEKAGIPTVSLSLLREVTEKVMPPRSLVVPYGFGYPLGAPDDTDFQHHIIHAALDLVQEKPLAPVIRDFTPPADSTPHLSKEH